MAKFKRIQRDRLLTDEEAARDEEVRRKAREEFPPKKRKRVTAQPVEISEIMSALKEARTGQGLTLVEAAQRAEIEAPNLSTLENSPDANPTLQTMLRYAKALGKTIHIVLKDA